MPALEFLDTSVFVYAYDVSEPRKRRTAQDQVRLALSGEIVRSTEVLAELAAAFLHKLSPPASVSHITTILDALSPIRTIAADTEMVRRAAEIRASCGIHFYDGMIVAAAEGSGATRIWSEDLNSGQE
jgi:predicted nucleic acid-binding protein